MASQCFRDLQASSSAYIRAGDGGGGDLQRKVAEKDEVRAVSTDDRELVSSRRTFIFRLRIRDYATTSNVST